MDKLTYTSSQLDNPFWQFSLAYWQDQAAQTALLSLQDDYGQNINILLFAIWLSTEKRSCIVPIMGEIHTINHQWQQEVVVKLRSARRALPANSEIKKSVQKVELEAERIEQALFFELYLKDQDTLFASEPNHVIHLLFDNLKCCFESNQQSMSDIPNSLIISLVQATDTRLSLEDIQHQLASWSTK